MNNLCTSSETYPIEINDIIALPDSPTASQNQPFKGVVVLLGNLQQNIPDTLLCGRDLLEKALQEGQQYIPVKFAFKNTVKKYNLITPLIKKLRSKYKIWSSNIYHISPFEIRKMKIERSFRDKDTAYTFTNPKYRRSDKQRRKRYNALYNSLKRGYKDKYPIEIMLLRMLGTKDTVNNGHHRIGIALECGLTRIAVRFSAAGQAPRLLQPLLKIIADIAIRHKQRKP